MTTRKTAVGDRSAAGRLFAALQAAQRPTLLFGVFAAGLLAFSGCATPGPLHLYTLSAQPSEPPAAIRDLGLATSATAEVPGFLAADDGLVGFAYDPYTDHFFLRLAPGNLIRVVDRPARAIKREFTVSSLTAPSRGDLAIRPRDGHVFAAHPTQPAVIEFTRFGETVRTLTLAGTRTPPAGLAFDSARDRLFALHGGDLASITIHDLTGQRLASVSLDRAVALTSLAYDSDHREFYAILLRDSALGIFSESGRFVRSLPLTPPSPATLLDVGPRSFLRLF